VELFHLFMLVHDDVMDNAALRRGRPTLRVALQAADPSLEWTQSRDLAVVMGNLLDVLAMQHMVGSGPGEARASGIVLEALCRAGSGQFHDLLGFRGLGEDDEAFRRELIDKAAYHGFAAPFAAGLCLARDDADPAPALAWGTHVGLAFQEADDLADLVGSPAELGKDSLRDLLQGRPSLPLLFLRRRAQGDDRDLLDGIAGRTSLEFGERARLDDLVRASGVVSDCAAWVRAELAEAARLRASSGFSEAARQGMEAIEQGLVAHVEHIVARASGDDEAR
jgi:geranylgeranyl pyrophosphate synthase